VTFGEETFRGRAVGVDETGSLILIDGSGKARRVIAGDVLLV
jgi:biotin-(acetyl-CoA carboxylase) ligase